MKQDTKATSDFGKRLAYFRKAKGLTQRRLGEIIGVSDRVVAYYEVETTYPPSHLIIPLSKALGITTDELLGVKEVKQDFDTAKSALRRRLKTVEELPTRDQKAILHYIDLVAKNRISKQKTA
jgi:transcriptional regulator with XRE-family HTH domain